MRLLDETASRRIMLVAPAGFGKTTLARQWVSEPRIGVWFRASPASTDVAALALGLGETFELILDGASGRLQERLAMSPSPREEAKQLGSLLGEDLQDWPSDAWLVIDDYHHLIGEPAAESFIEALVGRADIPVLITSRTRPSWASAKSLLYGEVAEFGRNVLAMTHEEAALAVPRDNEPGALAGLVALAEGWPAVIGLASLVQAPVHLSGGEMPDALHSYFAEELYQGIDPELQWSLIQLSLVATVDLELANLLFAERARAVLEAAYDRGFLNKDGDSFDLHPLLRQFLRTKLTDIDEDKVEETVHTLALCLLKRSAWDEAFSLAEEFELGEVFAEILTRALDDLLGKGRLATLEQWLDHARKWTPSDDIVPLAEIELAFRKGRWMEADDKARHLARRLPQKHPFASKALFRAALVAQLDDRQDESLSLLNEAKARSTTTADLRRALWSRFITLADSEEPELATAALHELENLPPSSIEDSVRISQAPIHFAVRWGGLREALERHSTALTLLDKTIDPLIRTGFIQSYGTALALAARYQEAYEVASRQIREAERSGLDWVRSHGLQLMGLAQLGLREFERAEKALKEAYRLAEENDDYHAKINALALMARLNLAQGDPAASLHLIEPARSRLASRGMEAEIRSIRALILATMGIQEEARLEISASASLSGHLEARCLRSFASAILSVAEDATDSGEQLAIALDQSSQTGNADSFVTAYRATPMLLRAISNSALSLDEFLLHPIATYDSMLGRKAGLGIRRAKPPTADSLTERENEILMLLRNGLSNRQIAGSLWIAESTVKVHVRHIFDKLGVRTRTAAALFRDELGT
jgi:LuxR family transcriptional regulator, maltose regulon positive regulatory protein